MATKSKYLDLLERTVWTGIQGGLAVWIATDSDLFSDDALKVAGVAAIIAAVKCILAFQVGSHNTAATLPARPDTNLGGQAGESQVTLLIVALIALVIVLAVVGVV